MRIKERLRTVNQKKNCNCTNVTDLKSRVPLSTSFYTLWNVQGSKIGRVQYFLNRDLHHLLECGTGDNQNERADEF